MSEFDYPEICEDCPQRVVVQCKDCKYGSDPVEGYIACNNDIGTVDCIIHEPNWFCADGERKEE